MKKELTLRDKWNMDSFEIIPAGKETQKAGASKEKDNGNGDKKRKNRK